MKTMKHIVANIGGSVSGEYQIQVVKKDGRITYPLGEKFHKNLILDSGINQFFSDRDNGWYGPVTAFCRAGSGTTAVNAAQTTLVAQLKSTNSYFAGSGANGTSNDTVNGKATHKRTYEFTAETGNTAYNELGIGPTASGADLFSRIVLPATLNLVDGDNLRIVYQLTISVPQIVTPTSVSLSTTGWDAEGEIKMTGTFASIFGTVAANGTYTGGDGLVVLSAGKAGSNSRASFLASNSTFPAVNTNASVASLALISTPGTKSTYVPGSFTQDLTLTFTPADPTTTITNVRSVFLRSFFNNASALQLLLDADQPKSNEYRLVFTFRFTWDRV